MIDTMNKKQQGDVGVAMAIAYYTREGYVVSVPLTDNARYDILIEKDSKVLRVQCKTTKYIEKNAYVVQLRTSGGNQSWSHEVKKISSTEADLLFVYAFDGTMYQFDGPEFDGKSNLRLGPSKKNNIVSTMA